MYLFPRITSESSSLTSSFGANFSTLKSNDGFSDSESLLLSESCCFLVRFERGCKLRFNASGENDRMLEVDSLLLTADRFSKESD